MIVSVFFIRCMVMAFHDTPFALIDRREKNITIKMLVDAGEVQAAGKWKCSFKNMSAADHENFLHTISFGMIYSVLDTVRYGNTIEPPVPVAGDHDAFAAGQWLADRFKC